MKLFLRYLRDRRGGILLFSAFVLIFALLFWLYRLPLRAVLYPTTLCAVVCVIYTAINYKRMKRRHSALLAFRDREDALPPPRDIEEEDLSKIIRLLTEQLRIADTRSQAERRAMMDYYTL